MTVAQLLASATAGEIGEWAAYLHGEATDWQETERQASPGKVLRARFAHLVKKKEP